MKFEKISIRNFRNFDDAADDDTLKHIQAAVDQPYTPKTRKLLMIFVQIVEFSFL